MTPRFPVGSLVQTPLGKGVVIEVRNNGRLLVEVHDRAVVFHTAEVSAIVAGTATRRVDRPAGEVTAFAASANADNAPLEVDLHGLTVEEALLCAARSVNDAALGNRTGLRFIHGRSGGRIRSALHRWLKEVPTVSGFHLDPRNPGVTVVSL